MAVLRPGSRDDIDVVAEFHRSCWLESYSGLVPGPVLDGVTVESMRRRWARRLSRPDDELVLGFEDVGAKGLELVGLVLVGPIGGEPATELRSLYVARRHHGTGLAAQLLRRALGQVAASLWVFEGNERARAFYAKHGWTPTGHRRIEPGTGLPELRMVRGAGVP